MAHDAGGDEIVVRPAKSSREPIEDDEIVVSTRRRHPPAWLIAASVGVLSGALIAIVVTKQRGGHEATLAPPSASATVTTTQPSSFADRTAVQLGPAADVALAEDGTLFVLGPNGLTRIASGGARKTTTMLPAGAAFVAVNKGAKTVWVVGQDANEVDGYEAVSLTRISRAHLRGDVQIQAIATLDDRLFLATTTGIFQLAAPDSVPRLLPGFPAGVQAITADQRRDQMLAVADDHSLLQIRSGRVRVTPPSSGGVLPDFLEVTEPGVWAVGFGLGGGPRIARVNPSTLALVPVGPGDPEAPQGTDGWPGGAVFWVRHAYSTTLICYDARTGAPAASYPNLTAVGDPNPHVKIVSQSGAAFAISGRDVFRLKTTPACPG